MVLVRILVGILLLLLGRRLFWLFVAAVGFVVAMELVFGFFPGTAEEGTTMLVALVIGLVAGVIGALLAIFLQQVAVGIVGFLAGGYIVFSLLQVFGLSETTILAWILALVGGIVGFILALSLLEWALILLSSLIGASLIVQSFEPNPALVALTLVVAVVIGVVVQARTLSTGRV